jgi:hypothetical protein
VSPSITFFIEEPAFQTIVEVVAVVGDLVGQVRDLGFDGRLSMFEVDGFASRRGGERALVLAQSFTHFPGKIQPEESGVFLFQLLDDAEALPVVIEAPVLAHEAVEGFFAGVAEGRVSEVVREGDEFDYQLGTGAFVRHKPRLSSEGRRFSA